jgi:acyl transferase domain-containing protein/acetyl esterase/lipase/acyl carrier protein
MTMAEKKVSAAFFCPQTTAADEAYLAGLHAFLSQHRYGRILLSEVATLGDPQLWEIFASARADVRGLSHGPKYLAVLRDWAMTGVSAPLASIRSNITSLPLLAVMQIGQYLQYLKVHHQSHQEFMEQIQQGAGGVHGYCGGLPAAISIACAEDETELIKHVATAIRIAVGIGAYTEAGDEDHGAAQTLLAIRLKYEGQGDELTRRFPGTYISAITGPRSISIGGAAATVSELFRYVTEDEGLRAQMIDLGGSAHSPENVQLAKDLCRLCREAPNLYLQLPDASQLRVPLRSNQNGARILHGSLTDDLITTNLAARCEWFELLKGIAQDLAQSPRLRHEFVVFGWTDCVTMAPFHQLRLQINKTMAKGLILLEQPPQGQGQGQGIEQELGLVEQEIEQEKVNGQKREQYQEKGNLHSPLNFNFPGNAIAIVGASCRLPGAGNMEELWDMLAKGTNCVQELSSIDRFDLPESFRSSQSASLTQRRTFYGNFIEDVKRFDHAFFGISSREAANMDPQQRLALELSFEALEDAGYLVSHQRASNDNVGCFIGLVLAEYVENTNGHAPTAYTSTGTVPAFVCGRISHTYGWSGPSEMFNTACSSSMVAINRACKAIQAGECCMALAGGVNVITGVNNYLDLAKAGFLSLTGQCKPFDVSADGYCRADGAGLVFLKKLGQAVADGDSILGVIAGVGTNQAGLSSSLTAPDPAAQQALYRAVLDQAGIQADQVTYVEAHGTGTQVGDPLEMESIRSVFGNGNAPRQQSVYVGSIKANVGHSEPAAGVAGLLKVLAMLRHGQIPPQTGFRLLNPKIVLPDEDGIVIPRSLRPWDASFRAALVNSYGAAGSNGALVCCEMPQPAPNQPSTIAPQVSFHLPIAGTSKTSLIENARVLGAYLGRKATDLGSCRLADVAFTLSQRRQRHKYLASVTADTIEGAAQALGSLSESEISELLISEPGTGTPIVFVFSGQSSSTISLPKSLPSSFPVFQSYLGACDAEFRKLGNPNLLPAIFQADTVNDIAALQCGIFAVQYACARCWIDAGAQPRALIGHSLGELTALAVSGVLSLADTIKLIATRGHLIATKWGPERGTMLALECTVDEWAGIAAAVRHENDDISQLEIACYNGPTSVVVAGTVDAIQAAENTLRTQPRFQRVRFQRLQTSHGFHSALTEPILADLEAVAHSLTWNDPSIPIYSCTENAGSGHQDVARHMRRPVFFGNAVRRVEDALGPSCLWFEAGIDTPITLMVRRACRQPNKHVFQPVKAQGRPCPADIIADTVAGLWHTGIILSHWAFLTLPHHPRVCRSVWLPPYQFVKTQHWVDHVDRAVEMQQEISRLENMSAPARSSGEAGTIPPTPPPLVARMQSPSATGAGCAEFVVNTGSARFRSVVSGHVVCSRPLCPAPLYMECATMGLLLLLEGNQGTVGDAHQVVKGKSLIFKELRVSHPLSLEPQGDMVLLRLRDVPGEQQTWKFSILSSSTSSGVRVRSAPGEIAHADGAISLALDPVLDSFQRLVSGDMQRFENSSQKEILQSRRAYGLFSRVVTYDGSFKGIQSVELDQHEALAMVELPNQQPHRSDSSAWQICDAVAVDVCVHVVGLLINTSDTLADEEVAVMVGLDRVVMSPAFTMDGAARWRVYASFADHQQQPIGDVFVSSPKGELVALFTGCRMTRLPVSRLERVLDAAFLTSKTPRKAGTSAYITPASSSTTITGTSGVESRSIINTPSTSTQASDEVTENARLALRDLIAECTGIDRSDIPETTALGLLGLDSLGAAELSEELSSKFGLSISSKNLVEHTLAGLNQLLGIQHEGPNLTPSHSQSPPHVVVPSSHDFESNSSRTISNDRQVIGDPRREKFLNLLAEVLGAQLEDVGPDISLDDLGIDSLSMIDLKQELEDSFSVNIELAPGSTIQQIMTLLGMANGEHSDARGQVKNNDSLPSTLNPAASVDDSIIQSNPFEALKALDTRFDSFARKHGILDYWSEMAPFQDELTLAYIVEGFASVGVDLRQFIAGEQVPLIPYLTPKYDKLVRRLWEILERRGVVVINSRDGGDMPQIISRGSQQIGDRPASQLLQAFDVRFPAYRNETKLIGLTGPRLAECLSGKVDSVSVMFGSSASLKIMEDYYGSSPISSTLTDQLAEFLTGLVSSSNSRRSVRILEAGGGTGGTTRWLAKALDAASIATEYTFTDISPSLVKKARSRFQPKYPWMAFTTFNLEEAIPPPFRGQFDIVVATNTVHATTDRTASVRRMREALTPAGGLVVLAELTCHIDWCDICFGLLDGWWLADGPIAPLQTAPEWMDTFAEAGFASMGYSTGDTLEAKTAQLLVASNIHWEMQTIPASVPEKEGSYRLQTMVYKEVYGVQIHADVYFPKQTSSSPLPIALMIHGGGHMLLSRRAIRSAQTRHLLRQGFLPVSIDYRLCPEINLIDGPITDVCDAYRWARTLLPEIALTEGRVQLDPSRMVVIGWSTGGHLAMSLGWTAKAAGMSPPNAVLSFYGPVDFESGELDSARFMFLPKPQMSLEQILSSLPAKPITNTTASSDSSELGWVQGNPRSELLLTLSQQGIALPVLLNGLDSSRSLDLTPPSPAHIASISPLARLRAGQYAVPTFIIHGSEDEVAPFPAAERFVAEMRGRGLRCEFLSLQGRRHLFALVTRLTLRGSTGTCTGSFLSGWASVGLGG